MEIIKKATRIFTMVSLGALIILGAFYNMFALTMDFPSPAEIQALDNVANHFPDEERIAVKRSRMSTVHVVSEAPSGRLTKLTGIYLTARKKFYVLTAAHGIVGTCATTWIWSRNMSYSDCKEIVLVDLESDYAIIEIEKMPALSPIIIPGMLPAAQEWTIVLAAQTKIYYTGFPNGSGLLTFDGRIAGYSDNGFICVNSHAWYGSSGSGVFNRAGKLIGYIVAIDAGRTEYGIEVIPGMMYAEPAFKVDWSVIL
jgi:hypothetical protein